jgi:ABC-type nitrate/sulfonate/bicarbonate transport system permease component
VFIVVITWYSVAPRYVSELVFPSPAAVWNAAVVLHARILNDALKTLYRVLAGWVIGCSTGILVGLLMTKFRWFYAIVNPLIELARPLPPVALIPFFIIWFGLADVGQITLIAVGCFMVMTISTFVAVSNVAPVYIKVGKTVGADSLSIYTTIIFPAILPALISGFRVAAALAFGVGIAAEFMGAQSGLGFLVMVARRTLETNTILLATIILGIESFLTDLAIRNIARRLLRWTDDPIGVLGVVKDTRFEEF